MTELKIQAGKDEESSWESNFVANWQELELIDIPQDTAIWMYRLQPCFIFVSLRLKFLGEIALDWVMCSFTYSVVSLIST